MASKRNRPARWLSGLLIALLLFAVGGSHVSASTTDTDGDGLADSFETAYGLNPHAIDSDHDGLLDPAEDLDDDGLSNLGEQMFGTKPRVADSDNDGVRDGDDDTGDGIPDWREQDNRPLPDPITPPLDDLTSDDYCYDPGDPAATGNCVGDPLGGKLIAIYGDSHAGQWIAALQVIALRRHWRLAGYATSGCPSVHIWRHLAGPFVQYCKSRRQAAEATMRKDPPKLVILTNSSWYGVTREEWAAGLRRVIESLPATSRVMVLADTPNMGLFVPACLKAHPTSIGECGVARSEVYRPGHNHLEKNVARSRGASFASMNPWVCPTKLCPPIVGHRLIWRDRDHLIPGYARQLAPALTALVAATMR